MQLAKLLYAAESYKTVFAFQIAIILASAWF